MTYHTGDIIVVREYDGWAGVRPARKLAFVGRARRDFNAADFWDALHDAQRIGLAFSRRFLVEHFIEVVEHKEFNLAD